MSNKSPAFQWYPKDILSSVRVQMMTLAEEGAYRRLLDFCWINGWIPNDAKKVSILIGKGCSVEIARNILDMFTDHPTDNNKLIHDRLEEERTKQESNANARRNAAAARWNKQGKSADNGKSGQPAEVRGKRDEAENPNGKQVKSKCNANAMQTDMQNDALHISSATSSSVTDTFKNSHTQSAGAKSDYERTVWEWLGDLRISPKEYPDWTECIDFGYSADNPAHRVAPESFQETYEFLEKQEGRKFRVTAKNVMDNLHFYLKQKNRSANTANENQKSAREIAIENCLICDERGLIKIDGKWKECAHKPNG